MAEFNSNKCIPMRDKIVCAFDLYGTLLSTSSIAAKLAAHFGQAKADEIATTWRKYQLEYTWRLNSMNLYQPFSDVTRSSLRHALAEASVSLKDAEMEELMQAYDSLSAFPDAASALDALGSHPTINVVVFSNGTQSMVSNSVYKSKDLKTYSSVIRDIVTVEDVKKYKPHPDVYRHLAGQIDRNPDSPSDMSRIWLVSGNPFDVVGARAVGMNAAWVDRAGNGWQDGLAGGEQGRPTVILKSLEDLVPELTKRQSTTTSCS